MEQEQENKEEPSPVSEPLPSYEKLSKKKIILRISCLEVEISNLEDNIGEAMEREDYDICAEMQESIDSKTEQIAKLKEDLETAEDTEEEVALPEQSEEAE